MAGGWVIEIDIRKYFDSIDHERLRDVLRGRIRDGVILRLLGKWLNAGVLEDGRVTLSDSGSPQGGVVSPILANIFLHEALDGWFEREVRPRLHGRAHLIRYADDAAMLFEHEEDARRVMAVLPKRFGKYGLTLHPPDCCHSNSRTGGNARVLAMEGPTSRAPSTSSASPSTGGRAR